ncbi:MOSC domain-containing protein [Acidipila sp. EB88]|uniref:MOSC domain-containing protein n=1 Tax=Acidipila sp. EB88 TaxID=2305226 RepID=UPI0013153852|nr:MOSC domain-containing protein [Acidipila sp. EB88]
MRKGAAGADEVVAKVHSLWRYPVKSMGGERVPQLLLDASGVYADRYLGFESSGAAKGKPLLTGAERARMLLCQARFRAEPAEQPGFQQQQGAPGELASLVEVLTPEGSVLRADDPALPGLLQQGLPVKHPMWLRTSERPMTDCRPIALLSMQTLRQISSELGQPVEAERFRANLLLDVVSTNDTEKPDGGFAEDRFVGCRLRIGAQAEILIKERDPRCRIITLDPRTGAPLPALMRLLADRHQGRAGVYATTLVPGPVCEGDVVRLIR